MPLALVVATEIEVPWIALRMKEHRCVGAGSAWSCQFAVVRNLKIDGELFSLVKVTVAIARIARS